MINHILIFINGRGLVSKSFPKFTIIAQYLKCYCRILLFETWDIEIRIKILGDLGWELKIGDLETKPLREFNWKSLILIESWFYLDTG